MGVASRIGKMLKTRVRPVPKNEKKVLKKKKSIKTEVGALLLRRKIIKLKRKYVYVSKQNKELKETNTVVVKQLQEQKVLKAELHKGIVEQHIKNQRLCVEGNLVKAQLQSAQELIRSLENNLNDVMQYTIDLSGVLTSGKCALSSYYTNLGRTRKSNKISFNNGSQKANHTGTTKIVQEIAPMVQGHSIHRPFIALERCNMEIVQDVPVVQRASTQADLANNNQEPSEQENSSPSELLSSDDTSGSSTIQNNLLSPVLEESENEEPPRTPKMRLGRRGRLLQRGKSKPDQVNAQSISPESQKENVAIGKTSSSSPSPLQEGKPLHNGRAFTKQTLSAEDEDPFEGSSWMFKCSGPESVHKKRTRIRRPFYHLPQIIDDSSDEENDYLSKLPKRTSQSNKPVLEEEDKPSDISPTLPKHPLDRVPSVLCENLTNISSSVDLSSIMSSMKNVNFKRKQRGGTFKGFSLDEVITSVRSLDSGGSPSVDINVSDSESKDCKSIANNDCNLLNERRKKDVNSTSCDRTVSNENETGKSCIVMLGKKCVSNGGASNVCETNSLVKGNEQLQPQTRCSVSVEEICPDRLSNGTANSKLVGEKGKEPKLPSNDSTPMVVLENGVDSLIERGDCGTKTQSSLKKISQESHQSRENSLNCSESQSSRPRRQRGDPPVYKISLAKKLRRDD